MDTNTQDILTQVGIQMAQMMTLLESLVRVEPEPVAKAIANIASQTKDAVTGFVPPFRIATKSHNSFARMLQALCEGADTETAMTVAGTKTAKDWIAKLGGIDSARNWALANFAKALEIAVTAPHEVVRTAGNALDNAILLAETYFAKREKEGKAFRLSQRLIGYGYDATSGAMFALVQAVVKDVRDKHFRAIGKSTKGLPTQVVKGTTNWEPLMTTATKLVTIDDGPIVFSRKTAKPRDTVHEVHDEVGSFFV